MSSTSVTIDRIPNRLRARGAALLLSEEFGRGNIDAGRQMLEAAVRYGIDLSNLWGSMDRDRREVREACLLAPGAGGTLVLFLSNPPLEAEARILELSEVLRAALDRPPAGSAIAQAILDIDDSGQRAALEGAGFINAGTLRYLRREPTPVAELPSLNERWPEGVTVELVDPVDHTELGLALEGSYEGTLDCPELCGLRETADIIASHRATGVWDPGLWWLVRDRGTPAGAGLFNPCPAQAHSELVYLGLAPSARGRGVASRLLNLGLDATLRKHRLPITCAVDERNTPAQKLYERAGFTLFERRVAFVRPLG